MPPADQEFRTTGGGVIEGQRNMNMTIVPGYHAERLALPDMRWNEAHLQRVGSGDDMPSLYLFFFLLPEKFRPTSVRKEFLFLLKY